MLHQTWVEENRLTLANPVIAATARARLRPCLYGENTRATQATAGRTNFSFFSLWQNFAYRLHEKQNVGSARMVPV